MADTLPLNFNIPTENLTLNIDYFDYAAGVGYKTFYLAGLQDSVGSEYALIQYSNLISDSLNYEVKGNGTDVDFDIKFNNPVTVAAADLIINYMTFQSDPAHSIVVQWTIYHYDGTTETSLGTNTDGGSTGGTNKRHMKAVKIFLTEKRFSPGDILRINAVITSNSASASFYIDPAGAYSVLIDGIRTGTSSSSVNIPFRVQN